MLLPRGHQPTLQHLDGVNVTPLLLDLPRAEDGLFVDASIHEIFENQVAILPT